MKVIPDDTMRGLELRKGSVDVVANDLPPDIVYQLDRSGDFRIDRSPGLDFSYIAFNMRDPVLRTSGSVTRSVMPSIATPSSSICVADWRRRLSG